MLIDNAHAAWRVSGKCPRTRWRSPPSYLFVLKRVGNALRGLTGREPDQFR